MTFTAELLSWYRVHHRDLPWRHTRDPYLIWISEVIFQQTRIRQGLEYYNRFTGRFPDVNTLAGASEEEVLKLWQGLGYYTRARNLHASAIYIARERGGRFPDSYKEILKLKGVGDYTAAAIASIAFRIPEPVVDGNVMRFVSRYAGITAAVDSPEGKQAIRHFAAQRIDREDPGTYNQAMMEFGALHCRQKNPLCNHCPFVRECFAFRQGKISDLPLKKKKASLKDRYFHYFVIGDGEMFWLNKRTGKDIWKNLYEFPLIETASPVSPEEILLSDAWKNLSGDGIFENTGRIS
ncbi:MAG: A/G-specific adenine glycosylase, partial [Syntrophothermus sp.]